MKIPFEFPLAPLLLPLALAGCGVEAAPDDGRAPAAFAGLPGTWEALGEATFLDEPVFDPPTDLQPTPGALARRADGPMVIRAVNVHEGREYRLTIDRDALSDVGALAQQRGLDRGVMPVDAGESASLVDTAVPFGWSDNDDSRTLRTNTTAWPYRAIGTLFDGGGDCTGTRVGPRVVLTAAHCIYNRATSSWNTINFKPGRNGTASAPYGSSGPHWYWVPQEYIDGAAGLNGYDIGVIVLDDAIGNGWMGYGAYSGGYLDDRSIYMRGYPRCGVTGAPLKNDGSDCDPKTLWGDPKVCEMGTFFNQDSDNWNREITTNCDGSAGQSGSSFYFYSPTSGNPVSMGVFSQHYCLGACTGSQAQYASWPNVITRITPSYRDTISYFRAAYPN